MCGGGAGLILIPVLGGLVPVMQVPAAISIGTFTGSFSRILAFKKFIRWHIVIWFVPAAIPAVWLGAWLLRFIDPLYLGVVIGLFLVSNIPFLFKKKKELHLVAKPKNYLLLIIGFLAGLLSGLTGAVGLLFNKFYLRYQLSKEEIIATRAANEIILHLIKIVLYLLFGLINIKVLMIGIVVAIASVLSTITMRFVLPYLSEFLFKKVGYFAMIASGLVMLSQSGGKLLTENNGSISANNIDKGVETKLKWQHADLAFEFTYNEGFEFEQVIPFGELSTDQQKKVNSFRSGADRIVIEVVYTLTNTSYEAYYYKGNNFLNKLDFQ